MGRKRIKITILNMAKYYKDGRGQGHGKNYRPWIYVHDFSSSGLTTEMTGWTTKRVHQLFSNGEKNYFQMLDWNEDITDIREQYPLFDDPAPSINTTLGLATKLGFRHPAITSARIPIVMTTDFLIDRVKNGSPCIEARAYKMEKDLSDYRTLEKLEIERLYWERQGVSWKVVTEKSINRTKLLNIEMIRLPELYFRHNGLTQELSARVGEEYLSHPELWDIALCESCITIDEALALPRGTAILAVKFLLSTKQWEIDMNLPFKTTRPLTLSKVNGGK